jgi:hypothetical protein
MKKNAYDYKKMMDDFELETRRKKMLNGLKNKWNEMSKVYYEKIEEMKLKNAKIFKQRDKEFKKKIKKKEQSIMRQLQLKNDKILEEKKKAMEIGKKKSDDVLKNLEEYNKKQEEERLKLEKDTFLKCN